MEKLTTKQRGDAAEHYVISMLGLKGGIPAAKMPDNWPGYDVVAQLPGDTQPLRISVKFRTHIDAPGALIGYEPKDHFDFIALVLKYPTGLHVDTAAHRRRRQRKQCERESERQVHQARVAGQIHRKAVPDLRRQFQTERGR
jgi:hypothetical protein